MASAAEEISTNTTSPGENLPQNEPAATGPAKALTTKSAPKTTTPSKRYNEVKPFNIFPGGVIICAGHRGKVDLPAPGRIYFEFSKENSLDLSLKIVRLKVVSAAAMALCSEHKCGTNGFIPTQFRTKSVISYDVAAPMSHISWEFDVPDDGGSVKFGVTFQLDMVATANFSRSKVESDLPCDKLMTKFTALNAKITDKIVSTIAIQLEQLDQQIQGQYQALLAALRSRFDHDIKQYSQSLPASLSSTPPALPQPGPEEPAVQGVIEITIANCRAGLASVQILQTQSKELLHNISSGALNELPTEIQSLLDQRQKACVSVLVCNRISIAKAQQTLEDCVSLSRSRSAELRKTFEDWRQDANKELHGMFLKHLDSRKMNSKAQHDRLWNRWLQTKQQLEAKHQNQLAKVQKQIEELSVLE